MGNTCTAVSEHRSGMLQTRIFSKRTSGSPSKSELSKVDDSNHVELETVIVYDTDDEAVEDSKLPKFARELIRKFNEEERKIPSDDVDPILLTKIRPSSITYEFIRENGTKQLFRASSLIDYMLATGHFHDPETRIPFTEEQLIELDVLGEKLGKPSVFLMKEQGNSYRPGDDPEDAFSAVEHCCGEAITDMIRIIETTRKSALQVAEVDLLVRVFPLFRHYLSIMFNLNRTETVITVDQYRRFLIGPPNHPTVDRTKVLLKFCLDFLDEVMKDLTTEANVNYPNPPERQ